MSKVLFTSSDLKRAADGSVDFEATASAFEGAVSKYLADVELETVEIARAVSTVFDKHRGVRMNMPYIIGQAAIVLNVQPENSKTLTDRIHSYIQENADQDAEYQKDEKGKVIGKGDERVQVKAPEPDRTRMFGIGKGKNGGVVRWSDVPVPAPKPASK